MPSGELAERAPRPADAPGDRPADVARDAEGNPLFIEELAASLAERADVERHDLPTSVQAIVAARLDALPPDERPSYRRIRRRTGLLARSARARWLMSTTSAGFWARSRNATSSVAKPCHASRATSSSRFKHALIHEVAYLRLPRAARRERHAAVAASWRRRRAIGQSPEAIADHWREAGENDRAVELSRRGGRQGGTRLGEGARGDALLRGPQLVAEDDPRRRTIRLRQAVTAQAFAHLVQE